MFIYFSFGVFETIDMVTILICSVPFSLGRSLLVCACVDDALHFIKIACEVLYILIHLSVSHPHSLSRTHTNAIYSASLRFFFSLSRARDERASE